MLELMIKYIKTYLVIVAGLILSVVAMGQEKKMLSGTVLNDAGHPVSDVTISIPGGENVYTDDKGEFLLPLETGKEWIVVNPIDIYHAKHLLLNNQDTIVIYVNRTTIDSQFDEITFTDGTKYRRDIVSSMNTLDETKFDENPYTSIGQYFQGRVSGAFVTNSSGMPGSGVSMSIRGYSSILSDNQPLYVVDGIPLENASIYNELIEGYNYDPLATIDPLDISEISVVKDAAAGAMYGVKGANGIVFIKTLEPQESKTVINVLLRTGISMKPDNLPQLNATQYKHLANEILFSSGMNEEQYTLEYPGLYYTPQEAEYLPYSHNTNWQNEVFTNARMQNMRFSIKGGGAIANYGLSVSYLDNEGIFKNTSLDRVNIRLVGSFGILPWLKMNIASNLTSNAANLKESAISSVSSPILSSLFKSPMLNPYEYDSEGNLLQIIDEVKDLGTSNPLAVADLLEGSSKNYRFLTTVSFDADITERIKLRSLIGLNSNNLKEFLFIPNRGFDLMYNKEVYNVTKAQNAMLFSVYNDNMIYYESPRYNSDHRINASIGIRWNKNDYEEDWGIGKNTASDDYTNLNRGNSILNELGGRNMMWNWAAAYSNFSYSYRDRYLLSGSVSADISSRLGKNAKDAFMLGSVPVGLFYSVGGAWRISEEDFLSSLYPLEELKLRVSYGIAGNDDIGEINTFNHYIVDQYRETSVLVPGRLANDELTYQANRQLNIGFDLSLFANRFSGSVNFFNNINNNLVLYEPQNSYLGYEYFPNNSATVSNTGIEIDLFSRIVSKKEFSFDIGGNYTKYSSIVEEIAGGAQLLNNYGNLTLINRVGEPVNSFYGYRYLGVYASNEDAELANLTSDRGIPYGAGDAIFENVQDQDGNSDQVINEDDMQVLGSFEPDFFGGAYVRARYKNWSVNLFMQGVYGNSIYNYVRYQNEKMTDLSNQSVKVLQRWQYDGQVTTIPKATWGDPQGNNAFSDRWIEDGSYLRLKEITLSYDLQGDVWALNSLKVFITATNLFTLTTYKGYDPEFSYSTSLLDQGVDYGGMPLSRSFMAGIKIGL